MVRGITASLAHVVAQLLLKDHPDRELTVSYPGNESKLRWRRNGQWSFRDGTEARPVSLLRLLRSKLGDARPGHLRVSLGKRGASAASVGDVVQFLASLKEGDIFVGWSEPGRNAVYTTFLKNARVVREAVIMWTMQDHVLREISIDLPAPQRTNAIRYTRLVGTRRQTETVSANAARRILHNPIKFAAHPITTDPVLRDLVRSKLAV